MYTTIAAGIDLPQAQIIEICRRHQVGEAVARLSPAIPRMPQCRGRISWGLRNILVHESFGIHWPLVWQTAVDHAPALRSQIADIVNTEPAD